MNNLISKNLQRRLSMAVVVFAVSLGLSPQQSRADDLTWTIAPYLWASDIALDVTVNDDPALGIDATFKDLLDKVDTALMGHFEVSSDTFGAFFEGIYFDLSDSKVINLGPGGPILGDIPVDIGITMKIYELGGFYRMGSGDVGSVAFDIIGGVRVVDVTQSFDLELPGPIGGPVSETIDGSETDIFVGGRLVGKFSEKWHYKLRADYAGGGTEGTINGLASVGYSFGQSGLFSLDLGYRYMNIEVKNEDTGDTVVIENTMSGPVLGFIFTF
jgi:hypothetical protein